MVDMSATNSASAASGLHVVASNETNELNPNPGIDRKNPSVVRVTIAGCGGCGMNLARNFYGDQTNPNVLYFDTSTTNSRFGERVHVVTNGDGSGSHRAENARDIERVITSFNEEEIGMADVAIVAFSLAGGSGSVIGPVIAREYVRRGMRVICVVVVDTSSATGAKNTINTLKTLTAIANNSDLYLPLVIVTNDQDKGRRAADQAAIATMTDMIDLLTKSVYEVDRNDRLNWINPAKVVGAQPGLKIMSTISNNSATDASVVVGLDSAEMVDSVLILQNQDTDDATSSRPPLSRLKKVGFYCSEHRPILGKVTGDIKAVDNIIDSVERVQQIDKSQRYDNVDRLNTKGGDDLIL